MHRPGGWQIVAQHGVKLPAGESRTRSRPPLRDLLRGLIGEGFSQAEIAGELGVTRQAIQKMLAG